MISPFRRPRSPTERVDAPPLTGVSEIDSIPPVLALAWPQQIADKVCAVFEDHSGHFSTRVRDLADLGLIADQVGGLEGGELIDALRAEETRRFPDTLPEGLPPRFELLQDQQAEWEANFTSASRGAPITFEDALARAAALIDPLLNESARGKRWDTGSRTYRES